MLIKYSAELIVQSNFQHTSLSDRYQRHSTIIKSGYGIKKLSGGKNRSILWVSRLEPWKQPEKFIKLAAGFPHEKFIMIAPLIKGYEDYGREIQKMASDLQCMDIIPFVHFHEIDNYYQKAKVFINTSEAEGFPNTFVQALKNGTPVLSLNVDPDDILEKNHCGFCCKNNESLMPEYLKRLLDNEKEYSTLSQNSYNYAVEHHDIKKSAEELCKLF